MCGSSLCPDTPQSTTTVAVTYCHQLQRWHAQVCSHSIDTEGGVLQHGAIVREFGPFDTHADVLQWAYREASAAIRALPDSLSRRRHTSPQGTEEGRSS